MKNVGKVDRIVRIMIGLLLLGLFFILEGNLRWFSLLGFVALGTALMNYCPLYGVCKINTNK